jgi:hypothetical protein
MINQFRRTNFAQFAIDQIINEVKKMGVKKKSVCCCLHHLVVIHYPSTGFVGAHKTTFFFWVFSNLLLLFNADIVS